MLKIHFIENGIPENIYCDMEKEFAMIHLDGCDADHKIIEEIDEGRYLDTFSFIDRFGYKLRKSKLSAGSKAALTVYHRPNQKYLLIELGINAISTIFRYCKESEVWIYEPQITFESVNGTDIDVLFNGYQFTNMDRLNYYIRYEYLYVKPNPNMGGVVYVNI